MTITRSDGAIDDLAEEQRRREANDGVEDDYGEQQRDDAQVRPVEGDSSAEGGPGGTLRTCPPPGDPIPVVHHSASITAVAKGRYSSGPAPGSARRPAAGTISLPGTVLGSQPAPREGHGAEGRRTPYCIAGRVRADCLFNEPLRVHFRKGHHDRPGLTGARPSALVTARPWFVKRTCPLICAEIPCLRAGY